LKPGFYRIQEFRSSGVQENPETEDLPGDRSDLTGEQRLQSPTEINDEWLPVMWG
jgi:hypothetical protein